MCRYIYSHGVKEVGTALTALERLGEIEEKLN